MKRVPVNTSVVFFILIIYLFISINQKSYAQKIDQTPLEKTGKFTDYKTMESYLSSLADSSDFISIKEIGKSDKNRVPIYLVTVSKNKGAKKEKVRVMIISRIHGSEPAGMEAAIQLIRDFANGSNPETSKYLDYCDFYIIPCVNPDGAKTALEYYRKTGGWWSKVGRTNGKRYDINRDFQALMTREARICVSAYNEISPHVILDLHEYSSIPLLVAGRGWWRAKYFDLLMGAGRHPDVYAPLAKYSREVCEKIIFPGLKEMNIRAYYYPGDTGDFSSIQNLGVTSADYFNLRNSLTFLIETSAYDQGESTIKTRCDRQMAVINLILQDVCKKRDNVKKLVMESKKYAGERETITLKMGKVPVDIEIDGEKTSQHNLVSGIKVNGKEYYSKVKVKFRDSNYQDREVLDMPSGYMITSPDSEFIDKLMLHGIKVYEALKVVRNQSVTIPRHAFYIPVDQESSAIIGYVLDKSALKENRFAMNGRVLVMPVELSLDLKNFRLIESPGEIPFVISRFNKFMAGLMENLGVEDKSDDN